jgi:hypothetical protein
MKFNLPAYTTNYFSTLIFVECPKCSKVAKVTSKPSLTILPIKNEAKIVCTNCNFKEENSTDWNGYCQGFLNQACGFCGSQILHSTKPTKEPYKNEKLNCTSCKNEKEYQLFWAPYRGNKATDPYFGYNLYLQTNIKNNVLWGYNKEHLYYLKAFIQATLREDNKRHKYSLIANLPQWMLAAKNRDIVVKKIGKMLTLKS